MLQVNSGQLQIIKTHKIRTQFALTDDTKLFTILFCMWISSKDYSKVLITS